MVVRRRCSFGAGERSRRGASHSVLASWKRSGCAHPRRGAGGVFHHRSEGCACRSFGAGPERSGEHPPARAFRWRVCCSDKAYRRQLVCTRHARLLTPCGLSCRVRRDRDRCMADRPPGTSSGRNLPLGTLHGRWTWRHANRRVYVRVSAARFSRVRGGVWQCSRLSGVWRSVLYGDLG